MRRRRIALMLRAMAMTAPSIVTTCGNQAHAPETAQPTPPAVEESEAARPAGQPIGGIATTSGPKPQPKARIETGASERRGVTRPLPAGAK